MFGRSAAKHLKRRADLAREETAFSCRGNQWGMQVLKTAEAIQVSKREPGMGTKVVRTETYVKQRNVVIRRKIR